MTKPPAPPAPAPAPRSFTAAELAEATLLFWAKGTWTEDLQARWNAVTRSSEDSVEAKSVVLVEMARSVLGASS